MQVATIQLQLAKVVVGRDAFDEALKVAQRGMQVRRQCLIEMRTLLPMTPPTLACTTAASQVPSDVQASLAQQAIHCLIMLRRYEQVGYLETSPPSMPCLVSSH